MGVGGVMSGCCVGGVGTGAVWDRGGEMGRGAGHRVVTAVTVVEQGVGLVVVRMGVTLAVMLVGAVVGAMVGVVQLRVGGGSETEGVGQMEGAPGVGVAASAHHYRCADVQGWHQRPGKAETNQHTPSTFTAQPAAGSSMKYIHTGVMHMLLVPSIQVYC